MSQAPEYADARLVAAEAEVRAVVLVEGSSDRAAVRALAARTGVDLDGEGVRVVSLGGATSVGAFVDLFGVRPGIRLGGLCDVREVRFFARALERAGWGQDLTTEELATRGFFVCDPDLEGELIAALGVAGVLQVVEQAGEVAAWETFRQQPAQVDRPPETQLHRFMGTRSGRKIAYARLLVEALDLQAVPPPLSGVVRWARG